MMKTKSIIELPGDRPGRSADLLSEKFSARKKMMVRYE